MSKHTLGPWDAIPDSSEDGTGDWYIVAPDEDVITLGLSEPDARLIAAAPDLLALVRDIRNLDHVRLAHGDEALLEDLRKWKAEARAAIAKAEGAS